MKISHEVFEGEKKVWEQFEGFVKESIEKENEKITMFFSSIETYKEVENDQCEKMAKELKKILPNIMNKQGQKKTKENNVKIAINVIAGLMMARYEGRNVIVLED